MLVNQHSSSQLGSSTWVIRNVFRNEGGVAAFYRGLASNLIGNSVSWALYFLWYDQIKTGLSTIHGTDGKLSYYDFFLASGAAGALLTYLLTDHILSVISGALTAICTNPIWVIKTRMLSTSVAHKGAYISTLDGIRRIARSEGLPGFYRGLVPSLFGVSHGAFQFMAYEKMKEYRGASILGGQEDLSNLDFLIFSGLSKVFAGSVTYPYQVIRARLQTYDADKRYHSARDVVSQVWRREGLSGFYKGLGPNLLRVVPSSCVTFLVYENTKSFLHMFFSREDSQHR